MKLEGFSLSEILSGADSGDVLVTMSNFPIMALRHREKQQGGEWNVCFSQSELSIGFSFLCARQLVAWQATVLQY